jgi:glutamyl-tRNA reductase
VQTAGEKRQAAVAQAEAIIDAGVQSFAHWLDQRAAVPVIQALNRQADDWAAIEMHRARRMLAKGETVEGVLEALARGLTHKMLHGTMAELHAADGGQRKNWCRRFRACSCARALASPAATSNVSFPGGRSGCAAARLDTVAAA